MTTCDISPKSKQNAGPGMPSELVHDRNLDFVGLAKINVFDEEGVKVPFGNLYRDQQTIVVFIRHFNCGMCKRYMVAMSKVRQEALDAAGAKLIFVGCGDPSYIKSYRAETGFRGAGYADPTRTIYSHLGMMSSMAWGPKGEGRKSYLDGESNWVNLVTSTIVSLKKPIDSMRFKNGNVSQNGGEFILGPGDTCSYASRMQHTQDHSEVAEVMRAAEVEYP